MPETSLAAKLKLKPGARAGLINAPQGYAAGLEPLPAGVEIHTRLEGQFDWIQAFVRRQAELDALAAALVAALRPVSLLWISFPKGSSKIQTDLTRDRGWDGLQKAGLKWINLVSVDETWSAFSLRPYKPGEAKQTFR